MKSLLIAFIALLGFNVAANAQCATGYTQLSGVYACQLTTGSWTPSNLTDGSMELWFDANNAASLSLTGSTVNSWTDLTNGVVMSAGGSAITYTASLLNGLPGLTFNNGSGQKLSATTTHAPVTATMSVLAVINRATTNYHYVFGAAPTGCYVPHVGLGNANPSPISLQEPCIGTSDSSTTLAVSTPAIVEWIAPAESGGSWGPVATYLNGNAGGNISAASGYSFTQTGVDIGGDGNFNGNMHEIVVLNTQATTTDRQLLEGYLAWKWGLQGSLPSGHPYKSAAP